MTDEEALGAQQGAYSLKGSGVALIVEGPTRLEVRDFQGESTAHLLEDGKTIAVTGGSPRLGEAAEGLVRATLLRCYDAVGRSAKMAAGENSRGEDGLIQRDGEQDLVLQITALHVGEEFFRGAKTMHGITREFDLRQVADWVKVSIDKKTAKTTDRGRVVLAIDARHCGVIAPREVARALRDMGVDVATLEFAEVWLIGPTVGTSARLDM